MTLRRHDIDAMARVLYTMCSFLASTNDFDSDAYSHRHGHHTSFLDHLMSAMEVMNQSADAHRKGAFNPQPLFDELKAYELDRVRAVARYAS